MGSDSVKDMVQQLLKSCGLDNKKLAVYMPNDADDIAAQVCLELGVVCEQKHVDAVADLIKEVRSEERLQSGPFA